MTLEASFVELVVSLADEVREGRCVPREEELRASCGWGTTGVLRVTTIYRMDEDISKVEYVFNLQVDVLCR